MGARESLALKARCFEPVLERQLDTLLICGCPENIVDDLRDLVPKVLRILCAEKFRARPGVIGALPVITFDVLSADHQMEWVKGEDRNGICTLTASKLYDHLSNPGKVHYILGVHDGRSFLNRSMKESLEAIDAEGRRPLTAAGGIALATHSEVLQHHSVDLADSTYGRIMEGGRVIAPGADVPVLWITNGRPELYHQPSDRYGFPKRGVPSRALEIVA